MALNIGGDRTGVLDGIEFGIAGPVYLAGRLVPAGRYLRVEGWGPEVALTAPGLLPPSFDGRVAIYQPVASPVPHLETGHNSQDAEMRQVAHPHQVGGGTGVRL